MTAMSTLITILMTTGLAVSGAGKEPVAELDSLEPADTKTAGLEILPDTLTPPDTSSPRDTIRSFLEDVRIVIEAWADLESDIHLEAYQAYNRMLATLDFSTTADGAARSIMNTRSFMLYEILMRIDLPRDSEIPGDEQVAQGDLDRWRIPTTDLILERAEEGLRQGEYLFSAGTVQRLPRYYRKIRHWPYKPDAIAGISEIAQRYINSAYRFEGPIRNRLKPIDTSNPRSTFEGFLDSVNRAYTLVMEANAALKEDPSTLARAKASEAEKVARNLIERAKGTLDLSKVPEAIREDVGIEAILMLKEVFDRMHLPPVESIPDLAMVRVERGQLGSSTSGDARAVRWRYPNTEIEIVEIMAGPRQGEFLFSTNTVAHIHDYYNRIHDLPYRDDYSAIVLEYFSPGLSPGFYNYYISAPGHLIQQYRLWGRMISRLPESLRAVYGGQTVWQWISLCLSLSASLLLLTMLRKWLFRHPRNISHASRHWRRVLFNLVAIGVMVLLDHALSDYINLTGSVFVACVTVIDMVFWILLSSSVFFTGCAIAEAIIVSPKINPEGLQASYLRALFGLLGFIAAAVIMINGLAKVGISLMPLLAGVGIGGLAIALAARPTLESIIGSFTIFADSPYRVGSRIRIQGREGVVESIGLRSTRFRLLSGHVNVIPNEKMAAMEIENVAERSYIRRIFNVTVTYDTGPKTIHRAVEIIRDILAVPETGCISPDNSGPPSEPHRNETVNQPGYPPRVYFNELNADSLNIYVSYWYHPPDYWEYMEYGHWINKQIMERFKTEGIKFAFPTQTIHLAENDGATLSQMAEQSPESSA